jgi:hypothetical protein
MKGRKMAGSAPVAPAAAVAAAPMPSSIGPLEVIADQVTLRATLMALRGMGQHELVGLLDLGNPIREHVPRGRISRHSAFGPRSPNRRAQSE